MRIALIGYGKMGAALMSQWRGVALERFADHRFFVIDPAVEPAPGGGAAEPTFLTEPPAVSDCAFDLIIVAVKPQLVDEVLPPYAERLAPGGFVASIAAGRFGMMRTVGAPPIRARRRAIEQPAAIEATKPPGARRSA